jgi:Ca2+-dependent lipid-binding protein, contains C2 domain
VLIVIGCFFLFVLVRYRLKHRNKYEPLTSTLKKSKTKKYVPGKTAAYFNGSHVDTATIPLTYPQTLQSGTPIVFPSFSNKKANYQSNGSFVFPKTRTIRYPGTPNQGLNRCASLDDQLFRKSFAIKPGGGDFKNRESPLARERENNESRVNSRNSFIMDQTDVQGGYISPPETSRNTMQMAGDTFYTHSEFFSDDDNSSLNPSTCGTLEDNVVSYDQEPDYKLSNKTSQSLSPAFLSFQLEYHSAVPELLVTVKNAFDLQPTADPASETVNSYVNLCLVPEDFLWKRTRVVNNDLDPVYNETFRIRDVLYHKLREYTLCLFVMDTHPLLGERPIGKILYPLSELRAEQAVDVCQELTPP